MKKAIFRAWAALLALLFLLGGCAGGPEEKDAPILAANPLIRAVADADGATCLLPGGDGVLALWERDGGFSASYVSAGKSALTESLIAADGSPTGAGFLETESGKGILAVGKRAWYLLLDGSGAEEKTLPGDVVFTGVCYRDEGFVCRKGSLLVLVPASLDDPLVLTDTDLFPGFGEVLTVTPDGKQIWFTKVDSSGKATALAAFRPGDTKIDEEIPLLFDEALPAPEDRVLLIRTGGEETVFTLLNLSSKETSSLTVPCGVEKPVLNAAASRLAFWDRAASKIRVYDFDAGEEIGVKDSTDLGDAAALCYGGDGSLYASMRRDGSEILMTLARP
ncbi:MAG: hypothetical protein J6Z79_05885 [Clostridia bacterium]|nr:hypothetical protein [Clostridia bacterium]